MVSSTWRKLHDASPQTRDKPEREMLRAAVQHHHDTYRTILLHPLRPIEIKAVFKVFNVITQHFSKKLEIIMISEMLPFQNAHVYLSRNQSTVSNLCWVKFPFKIRASRGNQKESSKFILNTLRTSPRSPVNNLVVGSSNDHSPRNNYQKHLLNTFLFK